MSPSQKQAVVEGLQARGGSVAFLGQGPNDVPPLRAAGVGLVVDDATAPARDAAEAVLGDGGLSCLAEAFPLGRSVRRSVAVLTALLLAPGLGALGALLAGGLLGLPAPLNPLQVLWLHCVSGLLLGAGLAWRPAETGLFRAASLPEHLLAPPLLRRTILCGVAGAAGAVLVHALALESGAGPVAASTMAFSLLVLCQCFWAANLRDGGPDAAVQRSFLPSTPFAAFLVLAVTVQVAAVHTGALQRLLDTTALGAGHWLVLILTAFVLVPLLELARWRLHRRRGRS
jgi:magnesium-transporting ATPase (P-type)